MLVPFKDDNPKITENTGFQAGSDSTPMANLHSVMIILILFRKSQLFLQSIYYCLN